MHNQLTIAHFNNACHYLGKQEDAFLVNNEIRRMVHDRLPGQLSACLDTQLLALSSQNRVYRIRKLKFNLCITRADMELGHLTEQLVANLMESLEQQLSVAHAGIKSYTDSADFHSALIVDLLAGRAWSQWEYDEFKHWQLVDDSEAILQLLLPQLNTVPLLLQRLQQRTNIERLFTCLDKRQLTILFQQWSTVSLSDSFSASIITDQSRWKQFAKLSALQNTRRGANAEDFIAQLLFRFCQQLLIRPTQNFSNCLRELATFQFIHDHGRKVLLLADRSGESIGVDDFQQQGIDSYLQGMARQFLFWLQGHKARRQAVTDLLFELPGSMNDDIEIEKESAEKIDADDETNTAQPQLFYSECAGLALLIPVAISLGLYQQCSAAFLRDAIALTLSNEDSKPDAGELAKTKQMDSALLKPEIFSSEIKDKEVIETPDWLMKIIPSVDVDAEDSRVFNLPATWRFGLSEIRQAQILDSQGTEQCRRLLLAQFAARLTGMSASSDRYLQANFLRCPGSIKISDSAIAVRLQPIPLRIVLDLAGYSNWSDILPWSTRRLTIEIQT
jgi:hypothetical protein